MRVVCLLALATLVACQYDLQNSGYSNNDPKEVKRVAASSPRVQPKDYTANGKTVDEKKPSQDAPTITSALGTLLHNVAMLPTRTLISTGPSGGNVHNTGTITSQVAPKTDIKASQTAARPSNDFLGIGRLLGFNNVKNNQATQNNQQGQGNVQVGGEMTNILSNTNNIEVSQVNNNNLPQSSPRPSYDVLRFLGNAVGMLTGKQDNTQGQHSIQQGGAQNNVGYNVNNVQVSQVNNNGGNQQPAYDVPGVGIIRVQDNRLTLQQHPQNDGLIHLGLPNIQASNLLNLALGKGNIINPRTTQQSGAINTAGTTENNVGQGQHNDQPRPEYVPQNYGPAAQYLPQNFFLGNHVFGQNLGQNNAQGQTNAQMGGAQTNVGNNANSINLGQTNNNGGQGGPQYDATNAPSYGQPGYVQPGYVQPGYVQPGYGNAAQYLPQNLVAGNLFNTKNLGQTSSQGQNNAQMGGAQTNVGNNANSINLGQTNNNGGQGGPQYDATNAPSYGQPGYVQPGYVQPGYVQPGYGNAAQYLPQNLVAGNLFNTKNLGQTSSQGQNNAQMGGAQTNVGNNANSINLGQTNNNGGQGGPQYDATNAPSYGQPEYVQPGYVQPGYVQPGYVQPGYGNAAQYLPQNLVAGNLFNTKNLGQTNSQGQNNAQMGGAQTNAGNNANSINLGQTNNNGKGPQYDATNAPSYGQPEYVQPGYVQPGYVQPGYVQPGYGNAAQYLPQNLVAGNLFNTKNLGQTNSQGQNNAQMGGAQTNAGNNANSINLGQTNNNGKGPQYDASKYMPSPSTYMPQLPTYGTGAGAADLIKNNLIHTQNLGQNNNQGQSSTQVGGAQTNVGENSNAINIGQTNNNGKGPQYDASKYMPSPSTYMPQLPTYGTGAGAADLIKNNLIHTQNLGQNNNQGQSNTQVGGAQTNVGNNSNAINIGQTNENGKNATPSYDTIKKLKLPEPEPEQSYRRRL